MKNILTTILLAPFRLLSLIMGEFKWSAPHWVFVLGRFLGNHPKVVGSVFLAAITVDAGYYYYETLPKPVSISATISSITMTPDRENAKPSEPRVRFHYDHAAIPADQVRPTGNPSAARIDLVGEDLINGVKISPDKKGKWRWENDNLLKFIPETDWPAGVKYTIALDRSIFIDNITLANNEYQFATPKFKVRFSGTKFYQDPTDSAIRRVVSTVKFSHPVDKSSFESRLSLKMKSNSHPYSVSYSKSLREAYIHSDSIILPENSDYMKLKLEAGIKNLYGGESSEEEKFAKVLVPNNQDFLKISKPQFDIVRNTADVPEQIIFLGFTDDINESEILKKLSLYQLPTTGKGYKGRRWYSPSEVDHTIILDSKKVEFKIIQNEFDASKYYSLVVDVDEEKALYLKIENNLTSTNGYVRKPFFDAVLRAPSYPQEISIAGEGSILTDSGNHQLSVLTRGVKALRYSVAKVLSGEINHLVTQTNGDITNPTFENWNFGEQDVAEYFSRVVRLPNAHPKEASYSSFDLSDYLPTEKDRFGLFIIEVQGWHAEYDMPISSLSDRRLILVTDLGLIVKNNKDMSHDVFVQSIVNGEPISNATVELLGRNGIAISTAVSDVDGHAFLPTTHGYTDAKTPTVYVVKTKDDISFIPFERHSRQINLSRFDIGGVRSNSSSGKALNAYLFTDRGIYRPSETINIGMIVKTEEFSNVENVPLELVIVDPRNKEISVHKYPLPEKGFADFQYDTELTSDTGRYRASLYLVRGGNQRGKNIGSVEFKVEEFQPDTMRIVSRLEAVSDVGWTNSQKVTPKISLSNLFGTPAQDRKVVANVVISPVNFFFNEYKNYHFTEHDFDQNKKSLRFDQKLPEKRTDESGNAEFEIDLGRFRSGTYQLQFSVEGFDQAGGRSVKAFNSTLISPLDHAIGYKADGNLNYISADSERNVHFINVDNHLKLQSASDLSLHLIEVQHISTLVKQTNQTYKYQSVKKEIVISQNNLEIGADGYDYKIDTTQPGDFVLEIRDSKDRRMSRLQYSVAGFANLAGRIDKNAELQLKLDKAEYSSGDFIQMSIKAPYAGAGLITIETDRVHHYKWFKTDQESTVQKVKLPQNIEGTAYINVAFVRDIGSTEIFTSPLSYAVVPFSVNRDKRRVSIHLEVAEVVKPGESMEIEFNASKPSRIAVFAIDEGILQVANYQNPKPLSHFLRKRALEVETLQMLDLILPDFDLVKQLSGVGGGNQAKKALAKNLNPFARKTDKPAVFWAGIHYADINRRVVMFDVPDTFSGELRVLAVAVSDEALGTASTKSIVRGPFVISPNVLTTSAPGDEFDVTVGVANIVEGSGKNAQIDIMVEPTDHLSIVGESKQVLNIDEGSEGKFTFRVKANQALGAAELRFTATYKDQTLTRTTGISVRPGTPYITDFQGGYNKRGNLNLDIKRNLYSNLAEQSITASASPLLVIDGLTSYLDGYPHGCTEQIVSKVFPVIGLSSHPAFAPHTPDVKRQFSYLIDKLRERQTSDGGFMFWPGNNTSRAYPTIYAMHFLIESESSGYPVPKDMMKRGKEYLRWYVQESSMSLTDQRNRANAIYLLTRMGEVTSNYLIDLEEILLADKKSSKKDGWKKDVLAIYMAATYKLLQKDAKAEELIEGYELNAKEKVYDFDFFSILADDAQYIYILSKHFEKRARALGGDNILELTDKIYRGEYNTISSAYAILALGAYSKLVLPADGKEKIVFTAKQKNKQEKILQAIAQPFLTAQYDVETNKVNVSADDGLFYLNTQAGFDLSFPKKPISEGLEIYRDFLDDHGEVITQFEQGKEISVRLKIRALNGHRRTNIAVVDLLPGGFEVIRESVPRSTDSWDADYVDVREDRVIYYGGFGRNVTEITYRVKLTASGDFVVPPAYADSMYDRSIRAVSKAGKFQVTASK